MLGSFSNPRLLFNILRLLSLVIVLWALHSCGGDTLTADVGMPGEDTVEVKVNYEYGLPVDSFMVVEGTIKPNEMLSHILLRHHVPWPEIDQVVKSSDGVFDVRNIRRGKNYTVFCNKDSTEKARYLVYESSAVEYIIFDLGDRKKVSRGQREIREIRREIAGEIKSSLYQTLVDQNASPALAMELSEIYAWSIDFYRIQKGDKFKVIYTDRFVEDTRVGVGNIQAALFEHRDEAFYAFPFEQDGHMDFFDEEANSLRKAFLKSPLKYGRISSAYTMKRYHPVQKRWKAHLGTDYAAPTGTPIMSVGDGVVTEARRKRFNGNYVKVKHNGTYTTQYLHMSRFAKGIKPGKYVRQGEVIGYVGSTGLATGPHVCFRFWKHGKQVDHRKEKLPPSLPVKKTHRPQFDQVRDSLKEALDAIPYQAVMKAEMASF
jgi:murein DD-endopeptidase MepM/ murein hydrolase activator NlpD